MKKCPKCSLASAEQAQRCDCGYSFINGSIEQSTVRTSNSKAAKVMIGVVSGIIALVFASMLKNCVSKNTYNKVDSSAAQVADHEYEKMLKSMEADLNKGLPMIVDPNTRVDRVSAGPGRKVTYHITFVKTDADSIDVGKLREQLTSQVERNVCTSPDMAGFRADKVIVSYEYSDKRGSPLMGVVIYPNDCR